MGEVGIENVRLSPFDSIGMNSAYREFTRQDWWPNYFCCWDYTVTKSHAKKWSELIRDPHCRVEKFFFMCKDHFDNDVHDSTRVEWRKRNDKFWLPNGNEQNNNYPTSGTNAIRVGIELGYKNFILLGADASYQEKLPEATREGNKWILKQTPKSNPNYFFNDYQVAGDAYNTPNCQGHHVPAWEEFSKQQSKYGIKIINCSPHTSLSCFEMRDWQKELF